MATTSDGSGHVSNGLKWLFRGLLVGVVMLDSVAGAVRGRTQLPPEIDSYMTRIARETTTPGFLLGATGNLVIGTVVSVVAIIGLWYFARWARTLFVIALVAFPVA